MIDWWYIWGDLKSEQHTRHPKSINPLLGTALFGKPGTIRYASASEAGEEVQRKCLESWGRPKPLKRLTGLAWWTGSFYSNQMHLLKDEMHETLKFQPWNFKWRPLVTWCWFPACWHLFHCLIFLVINNYTDYIERKCFGVLVVAYNVHGDSH